MDQGFYLPVFDPTQFLAISRCSYSDSGIIFYFFDTIFSLFPFWNLCYVKAPAVNEKIAHNLNRWEELEFHFMISFLPQFAQLNFNSEGQLWPAVGY